MAILGLKVTQRIAYKITTTRKHGDSVADNLLNQNSTQWHPTRYGRVM
jgi:putative transposase